MTNIRSFVLAGLVIGAALLGTSTANAGGGRTLSGGHPYHNGDLFIPPASAYEGVNYRPPLRYGAPAYYFSSSYLAPEHVVPYPPMRTVIIEDRYGPYYFRDQHIGYFRVW